MANPEQLAILKQGVGEWNEWRQKNPDTDVDLTQANLRGAELAGADFSGLDLSTVDFSGAKLREANLSKAQISRAQLSYAYLRRAILVDANLTLGNLHTADLSAADLSGANLSGANLRDADLTDATLRGTDLRWANLSEAGLIGTDLNGANLSRADLSMANLNHAKLSDTEFANARVGWTLFVDIDLRGAKGLEGIVHRGPSYIGIDTIYKSTGEISEIFLRGAGVPDTFITYMKSFAGTVIQFYSCFISYSTKDQEFAERLYSDLQTNCIRCWFAPHDIQGGKKIHEQIDEAIRLHDKLLLILSPASMKSAWVETEIAKARKREVRNARRVLFPVRLVDFQALQDWEFFDADTGKDSAREIREFFIPDFSDWKNHGSYQKAFQRLLRDLKAEAKV